MTDARPVSTAVTYHTIAGNGVSVSSYSGAGTPLGGSMRVTSLTTGRPVQPMQAMAGPVMVSSIAAPPPRGVPLTPRGRLESPRVLSRDPLRTSSASLPRAAFSGALPQQDVLRRSEASASALMLRGTSEGSRGRSPEPGPQAWGSSLPALASPRGRTVQACSSPSHATATQAAFPCPPVVMAASPPAPNTEPIAVLPRPASPDSRSMSHWQRHSRIPAVPANDLANVHNQAAAGPERFLI